MNCKDKIVQNDLPMTTTAVKEEEEEVVDAVKTIITRDTLATPTVACDAVLHAASQRLTVARQQNTSLCKLAHEWCLELVPIRSHPVKVIPTGIVLFHIVYRGDECQSGLVIIDKAALLSLFSTKSDMAALKPFKQCETMRVRDNCQKMHYVPEQ